MIANKMHAPHSARLSPFLLSCERLSFTAKIKHAGLLVLAHLTMLEEEEAAFASREREGCTDAGSKAGAAGGESIEGEPGAVQREVQMLNKARRALRVLRLVRAGGLLTFPSSFSLPLLLFSPLLSLAPRPKIRRSPASRPLEAR